MSDRQILLRLALSVFVVTALGAGILLIEADEATDRATVLTRR